MDSLEPLLFFRIFIACLCASSDTSEGQRARLVMEWVGNNLTKLSRQLDRDEKDLMSVLWGYWAEYKSLPSEQTVLSLIRKRNRPDSLLSKMEDFRAHKEFILTVPHYYDMDGLLADLKEGREQCLMGYAFSCAGRITAGHIVIDPKQPPLSGPRDALAYVTDRAQSILFRDRKTSRFQLPRDAETIQESYNDILYERTNGAGPILTGLNALDSVIGGIRRGSIWGILGFAGQRKSAVCRTIAYRAAISGSRVLHIPLEITAKEERDAYGIIHANHGARLHGSNPSISRFNEGRLSNTEHRHLTEMVIPDLQRIQGSIIIIEPDQRTWPAVKQLIEMENRKEPLDLVVIDYLTLIDVPESSHMVDSMNKIIKEAKQLCLEIGEGGLSIVTPVQGSRNGYNEAKASGGVWSKEGVGQYNEFEKSLDVLAYVYSDDLLSSENKIKVGTCKSRRSPDMPCTTMSICQHSGLISDLYVTGPSEHWDDDRNILEAIS